jgi:damage-control phosphatase, subfamily III
MSSIVLRYETVVKRWPVILTGVIDHLHNLNHNLSLQFQSLSDEAQNGIIKAKIAESTAIIEKISRLKYQMGRDKALEYVPPFRLRGFTVTQSSLPLR